MKEVRVRIGMQCRLRGRRRKRWIFLDIFNIHGYCHTTAFFTLYSFSSLGAKWEKKEFWWARLKRHISSVCHDVQNPCSSASKCQNNLHVFKMLIAPINRLKTQINQHGVNSARTAQETHCASVSKKNCQLMLDRKILLLLLRSK